MPFKANFPQNLCVWCCVQCWYLASYSITDKESKIFLIFIGVRGDECMLILSLARHIATTYINTGHSSALLLHQASDNITNTRYIYRYIYVKIDHITLSFRMLQSDPPRPLHWYNVDLSNRSKEFNRMIIIFAWLYIVSMILIKTRSRTSPHLWTGCVALDTMFAATSFHYGYLISASLSRTEPSWYYGGASSAIASWPVCEDLLRFLFLMFCWLSYQPQPAAEVESGDTSTCHQHSGTSGSSLTIYIHLLFDPHPITLL